MKKRMFAALTGFFAGILNGLFGSGGGIIAVPLLQKNGLTVKESHATALFMMFSLSFLSVWLYSSEGTADFFDALEFIPGGILGAVFAAVFFRKIKPFLLKKIFGGFVTFSAARMLWEVIAQWI